MFQARFACIVAFAGCAIPEPDLSTTAGMSLEELRAVTPYDPVVGAYIVDGDIALRGDDALHAYWEALQQGALSVMHKNGQDVVWSPAQRKQLTYCISNEFGSLKPYIVDAMQLAAEGGWEMMSDVDFIYSPAHDASCNASNTAVLFDIRPVNSGGDYLAVAFFPDEPRSGRSVFVDYDSFYASFPLSNIMAHELGHVLGFRHEHIRSPGMECLEDTQYRPLTAYDAASVMHYPHCGGTSTNLGFTGTDASGARLLYAASAPNQPPMTHINAPVDGATVPPTFDVDASIIDDDLVAGGLFIDGELYAKREAPPFVFRVVNLPTGPHELTVAGLDATDQVTTRTITVTVQPSTTGGDDDDDDDGDDDGEREEDGGGCNATGSSGLGLAFALLAVRRRRRAR